MPKIIENLDKTIFEEVHKQLSSTTYSNLTIRSIANACGIGIGTIYNYYSSKDQLVAQYLLDDWNQCLSVINETCANTDSNEVASRCIFEQLNDYITRHKNIFRDEMAIKSFHNTFGKYHHFLRNQIAIPLVKFCSTDFVVEFIAEALLTWIVAGKSFDEIYEIIKKCF